MHSETAYGVCRIIERNDGIGGDAGPETSLLLGTESRPMLFGTCGFQNPLGHLNLPKEFIVVGNA